MVCVLRTVSEVFSIACFEPDGSAILNRIASSAGNVALGDVGSQTIRPPFANP
jgi:hypothetical protein